VVSAVSWLNCRGKEPEILRLARFLHKEGQSPVSTAYLPSVCQQPPDAGLCLPALRAARAGRKAVTTSLGNKEAHLPTTYKAVTRPAPQVTCFQGLGEHGLPAGESGTTHFILRCGLLLVVAAVPCTLAAGVEVCLDRCGGILGRLQHVSQRTRADVSAVVPWDVAHACV
jgi:hypothetical protein